MKDINLTYMYYFSL